MLDDVYPKIRKRVLDEEELKRQDELDRLKAADAKRIKDNAVSPTNCMTEEEKKGICKAGT